MRGQSVNRKFGPETSFSPWPAFPIEVIVFLVGAFVYVWLRVEPRLEYYSYGPYFYRHHAFWEKFLNRPGGLADYAGVFLAQLNCLNWLGALVFTLSEFVVLVATRCCLIRISGRAPGLFVLVPLFALLLLRNRYGCSVPTLTVGLILGLTVSAAHLQLPWRSPWLLTAVAGLISGVLFFVAGIWTTLLYAGLCCLFIFIQLRNRPAGLSCLALASAAPLLVLTAGNVDIAGLFKPWPEGVDWVLAAVLYASVPVTGAVLAFLPKPSTAPPMPGRWFQNRWHGQAVAVSALLLGWTAVWLTFDSRPKFLAEIDRAASCAQYNTVLSAASRIRALNDPAKIRLQLALYHTGRLAEDLFSFHDMIEEAPSRIAEISRAQSELLFELGLVNDAEHMASEALVMEGDRPDLLRLLARINLLKDRPQAAQVFLNVLSLIPFQGERANANWPKVDPQRLAVQHASLTQRSTLLLTNDVLHEGLPFGRLLDVLLVANPTNQMAFEYVMAEYLLELDLKNAVEHLTLLDNFNYARVPRPYEEALLLFQQLARVQVELKGHTVRPETTQRFRQFKEAAKQFGGTPEDLAVMAAKFGDTYWYYYYAVRGRERAAASFQNSPPR
jgi:hypothetical protein